MRPTYEELEKRITELELRLGSKPEKGEKTNADFEYINPDIFNSLHEGIIISDEQLKIIEINTKALLVFGYSKQELEGRQLDILIFQKDGEHLTSGNDFDIKSPQTEALNNQTATGKRKNGEIFPVQLTTTAVTHAGRIIFITTLKELSDKNTTTDFVRQREARYKYLFQLYRNMADIVPDMIWEKNLDKKYIFVNKSICENLLNASDTQEPIGKDDLFFAMRERNSKPDDPTWHTFGEICQDSDSSVLQTGKPGRFDEYGNVKGKFLFLDVIKTPMFDENGKLTGVIGTARDITQIKKAETELIHINEKQKALLDANPDLMFVFNSEYRIVDYHTSIADSDLYTIPEIFLGKTIFEILPPEVCEITKRNVDNVLVNNLPSYDNYSLEIAGEVRFFESRYVKASQNEVLSIVRNITEKVKTEEKLSVQLKLRQLLIEIASRYINLPLDQMDKSIIDSLERMGRFVESDRAYIFDLNDETGICSNTYEWCNHEIVPQIDELTDIPLESRWVSEFKKGRYILIPDIAELPESYEKEILEPQGIKSLLAVPMTDKGHCIGFVGFDSVSNHHDYNENEIQLLMLYAEILVNIKSRQNSEKELILAQNQSLENHTLYKQIFEKSSDNIFILDVFEESRFKLAAFNPAEEKLLGNLSDFQGKYLEDCLSPEMLRKVLPNYERCISERNLITYEESHEFRGKTKYFTTQLIPLFDKNQKIFRIIGVTHDITDRKISEEQTSYQSNLRKLLIELSSNFINRPLKDIPLAIDNALFRLGEFVEADRAYVFNYDFIERKGCNTYEWSRPGINPQKEFLQNIPFEGLEHWVSMHSMGKIVSIGNINEIEDNELRRFVESQSVVSVITIPLMNGTKCEGFVGFDYVRVHHNFSDIEQELLQVFAQMLVNVQIRIHTEEELIKARIKAEESDRLKTAFLQNMSHEIRTPMNGIIGFIDLLKSPDIPDEEKDQYIRIVEQSGHRLLNTINDIIEVSKIEAGQVEVAKSVFNTAEIMEYYHNFFKKQCRDKNIDLILDNYITGEEAIISSDKNKIESIISNLINNAIKFTNSGEIHIGNFLMENELRFYVKDTGIGINPDRIDAIFERFIQAEIRRTRPHEGSGLGLAIVKSYIELLEGRIWVESIPAQGSWFWFSIPYNSEAILSDNQAEISEPSLSIPGKVKILVAEDDDNSFRLLSAILNKYQLSIVRTLDGQQTIDTFIAQPDISIILMDIKMPGIDGFEATREIRKINKVIPIIAQTAFAFAGDKKEALSCGCTDFITKPIIKNEFLNIINTYLKIEQIGT
jgi:PAS domain S-box-containing protein